MGDAEHWKFHFYQMKGYFGQNQNILFLFGKAQILDFPNSLARNQVEIGYQIILAAFIN